MDDPQNKPDPGTTENYIVSITVPRSPRPGTQWFNPSDGKLKIFRDTRNGWSNIN